MERMVIMKKKYFFIPLLFLLCAFVYYMFDTQINSLQVHNDTKSYKNTVVPSNMDFKSNGKILKKLEYTTSYSNSALAFEQACYTDNTGTIYVYDSSSKALVMISFINSEHYKPNTSKPDNTALVKAVQNKLSQFTDLKDYTLSSEPVHDSLGLCTLTWINAGNSTSESGKISVITDAYGNLMYIFMSEGVHHKNELLKQWYVNISKEKAMDILETTLKDYAKNRYNSSLASLSIDEDWKTGNGELVFNKQNRIVWHYFVTIKLEPTLGSSIQQIQRRIEIDAISGEVLYLWQ